jgi:putative zinc finger/helix-turn-helix YgiT family protein
MRCTRSVTITPAPAKPITPCPECGCGRIETETIAHSFPYGHGDSKVDLTTSVPLHRCHDCGAEFLDSTAETLMHDEVCRHLGVMTPAEIRLLRERCGDLTRAEFARITKLGEATVGRWERGELIQNSANDQLLYLLTFPENVIRLRERLASSSGGKGSTHGSEPRAKFRVLSVTADTIMRAGSFRLAAAGAA